VKKKATPKATPKQKATPRPARRTPRPAAPKKAAAVEAAPAPPPAADVASPVARGLAQELEAIASGCAADEGHVERLADAWVAGLGARATPGVKENVATALRAQTERQRADGLLVLLRRVGE